MTQTGGYTSRNPVIDIFRGLVMTIMIFVNNFWTIDYAHWLGHAEATEDMLGFADIVFPCFLIAVGMSIPYAIENHFAKGRSAVQTVGHILSRSLSLIVMGLILVNLENGVSSEAIFPKYIFVLLTVLDFFLIWNHYSGKRPALSHTLRALGAVLLIFIAVAYKSPEGGPLVPSWWGILGLIGWTYLVVAFLYLFTRDRLKYLLIAFSVFILWNFLTCDPINGKSVYDINAGGALAALTETFHIETGAHCALAVFGVILSVTEIKTREKSSRTRLCLAASAALASLAAGLITNRVWICSKIQATAPWVFYVIAIAIVLYTVIYLVCKQGCAKVFAPVTPAGKATLTCYLMPYLVYNLWILFGMSFDKGIFAHGILGYLSCLALSFLCIGLTYLLGKVKISIKL